MRPSTAASNDDFRTAGTGANRDDRTKVPFAMLTPAG